MGPALIERSRGSVLDKFLIGGRDGTTDPRGHDGTTRFIIGLISHPQTTALIREHVEVNLFAKDSLIKKLAKAVSLNKTSNKLVASRESGDDTGASTTTTAGRNKRKRRESSTKESSTRRKTRKKKRSTTTKSTKDTTTESSNEKNPEEKQDNGSGGEDSSIEVAAKNSHANPHSHGADKVAGDDSTDANDDDEVASSHQANRQDGSSPTINYGTALGGKNDSDAAAGEDPQQEQGCSSFTMNKITTEEEEEENMILKVAENSQDVRVLAEIFDVMTDFIPILRGAAPFDDYPDIIPHMKSIEALISEFASLEFKEDNTENICTICCSPCHPNETLSSHLCSVHMDQFIRQNRKPKGFLVSLVGQFVEQDESEEHARNLDKAAQQNPGEDNNIDVDDTNTTPTGQNQSEANPDYNDDSVVLDSDALEGNLDDVEGYDEYLQIMHPHDAHADMLRGIDLQSVFDTESLQPELVGFVCFCCDRGVDAGDGMNIHNFMAQHTYVKTLPNYSHDYNRTPQNASVCNSCMNTALEVRNVG